MAPEETEALKKAMKNRRDAIFAAVAEAHPQMADPAAAEAAVKNCQHEVYTVLYGGGRFKGDLSANYGHYLPSRAFPQPFAAVPDRFVAPYSRDQAGLARAPAPTAPVGSELAKSIWATTKAAETAQARLETTAPGPEPALDPLAASLAKLDVRSAPEATLPAAYKPNQFLGCATGSRVVGRQGVGLDPSSAPRAANQEALSSSVPLPLTEHPEQGAQ
ncbi:hypothetical protein B0T26DRAFT_798761 [Lasiosphaeria miniovina]|uniref:Uncharacterized protein n=1 Tax=Lasiosphaeria miniovina TaxID=1954250 RepID=A0AA40BJ46_9PEZI|nr:uncharacterized protein B0T26DRAFT_798761 [Lasiosphaeria miniovina]KAK0735083.1 hypothetical protein B0T26DRAFT_798761 [Lasiosphaeria miniovina]